MEMPLKFRVIECTDQILSRELGMIHRSVLENKYTNGVDVSTIDYKMSEQEYNKFHDCDDEDMGYIKFYDEFQDRYIFVTSKDIGKSELFHKDFNIQSIWNVIKPCSNHEHSSYMTKQMKEWFVTNIKYVCLQMFETKGNIALFCNCGRSRSPMYLVAYLVLFCNKSMDVAMGIVDRSLHESRKYSLDRHCSLYAIVVIIAGTVVITT